MASFKGKHVAKVWTNSPEQTYLLGKKAAEFVYDGLCIMLSGDLGSGKTVFVKGLVHGLGEDEARSPSFNLVNEYDGRMKVAHADLYRLRETGGYELGLFDYLNDGYVVVVEWCERWISPPSYDLWSFSFELVDIEEGNFYEIGNKRKIKLGCVGEKACKNLSMYLDDINLGEIKVCLY